MNFTKMSPATINLITNIVGLLLFVLVPVKTYLESQPFDWGTFGLCIGGAIIAYLTGKSGIRSEKMLKQMQIEKGIITSDDLKGSIFGSTADFYIGSYMLLRTEKGKLISEEVKKVLAGVTELIKSPEGQKWLESFHKAFGGKENAIT
jgi:hypothetical protein